MSSTITLNELIISHKDRVDPSKLSIEASLVDEPMDASPPPNTPATAALEEYGQESMIQARRFLVFKPREFLPALKICTGTFLPDDQPIMAAPPNSPTTSHRTKFEDAEEMALLPWALALKAGGLDSSEEAFPGVSIDANNSSIPSQVLSPVSSVFSDDGSSNSSGDEGVTGGCQMSL